MEYALIIVLIIILVLFLYRNRRENRKTERKVTIVYVPNSKPKENPDAGMQELATPDNFRVSGTPQDFTSDLWKTSYSHPAYDSVGRRDTTIDNGAVSDNDREGSVIGVAFPGTGVSRPDTVYEHL